MAAIPKVNALWYGSAAMNDIEKFLSLVHQYGLIRSVFLLFGLGLVIALGIVFRPTLVCLGEFIRDKAKKWFQRKSSAAQLCSVLMHTLRTIHTTKRHHLFELSYSSDPTIQSVVRESGRYEQRYIIESLIKGYEINCYADSDCFFAAIMLFRERLKSSNIDAIIEKHRDNNQAAVFWYLKKIREVRPRLRFSRYAKKYMEEKTKEEAAI